jgi:hypothetical protein
VLNEPERWSRERLKKLAASNRTRWVRLKEPLPVILAYWTAEAGEDGKVRFREDVYGRDATLLSALDADGPVRILFRDPVPAKTKSAASPLPEERETAAPTEQRKTLSRSSPREGAVAAAH